MKERLGHLKLSTTERYLHSLPTADEAALTALDKIRGAEKGGDAAELEAAKEKIADLQAVIADQALTQLQQDNRRLRPA